MKNPNKRPESIQNYIDCGLYNEAASLFLEKTNSTIEWKFNGFSNRFGRTSKHFAEFELETMEFSFTLKRGSREYKGLYNNSINDTQKFLLGKMYTPQSEYYCFNDNTSKIKVSKNSLAIKEAIQSAKALTLSLYNKGVDLDKLTAKQKSYRISDLNMTSSLGEFEYPSAYDLLACLQKYEVSESVDDFASEFGYDLRNTTLNNIIKVHQACLHEYRSLCNLYNDAELAELQEIA